MIGTVVDGVLQRDGYSCGDFACAMFYLVAVFGMRVASTLVVAFGPVITAVRPLILRSIEQACAQPLELVRVRVHERVCVCDDVVRRRHCWRVGMLAFAWHCPPHVLALVVACGRSRTRCPFIVMGCVMCECNVRGWRSSMCVHVSTYCTNCSSHAGASSGKCVMQRPVRKINQHHAHHVCVLCLRCRLDEGHSGRVCVATRRHCDDRRGDCNVAPDAADTTARLVGNEQATRGPSYVAATGGQWWCLLIQCLRRLIQSSLPR